MKRALFKIDRLLHTLSIVKQEVNNLELTRSFLFKELNEIRSMHRSRRSLIPIVGKALSFLFGTLSEDDVSAIKANIRTIRKNQQVLSHVVRESLTIMKTTQAQSLKNTKTINNVIDVVSALNNSVGQLKLEVLHLREHLYIYTELDFALSEAKELVSLARDQAQHLKLQLNLLSLGHLSPSVISPFKLKELLLEIQEKLDPKVKFPFDSRSGLWDFYKTLTCTTLIENDSLVIVMAIPLIDTTASTGDSYELFRVHSFAIPRNRANQTTLLASYNLEANAIAVDKKQRSSLYLPPRK